MWTDVLYQRACAVISQIVCMQKEVLLGAASVQCTASPESARSLSSSTEQHAKDSTSSSQCFVRATAAADTEKHKLQADCTSAHPPTELEPRSSAATGSIILEGQAVVGVSASPTPQQSSAVGRSASPSPLQCSALTSARKSAPADDSVELDAVIDAKLQELQRENARLRQQLADMGAGKPMTQPCTNTDKTVHHFEHRVEQLHIQLDKQQRDHQEQRQRERRDAARACAAAAMRVRDLECRLETCERQRDQCMRAACAAQQLLEQLGAM